MAVLVPVNVPVDEVASDGDSRILIDADECRKQIDRAPRVRVGSLTPVSGLFRIEIAL